MSGFTLLEILISLFLLSLILLGLDAMELAALREAQTAYSFAVAAEQAKAISGRIRVKQGRDMTEWVQHLTNGKGSVRGNYPHQQIIIFWGAQEMHACEKDIIKKNGCLHLDL